MGNEINLLAVVPMREFNDEELGVIKKILEQNSIGVRIVASEVAECYGMTGEIVQAEYCFRGITTEDFEGIIIIGGPGVEKYFIDEAVLNLVEECNRAGKLVAAIDWAPVVLGKAGIMNGRKATLSPEARMEIESVGGTFTNETVTVDGNIITAKAPDDAFELGQRIVEALL